MTKISISRTLRFGLPAVALVALTGLGACGNSTVLRSGDACGAGSSQSIVGANRAAAEAFAAQQTASGTPTRVSGPTDAVTLDFNPSRLNIILDGNGTVISVACG